jgi:hypothetical protein
MATLAEKVYEADANEHGPWRSLQDVTELPAEALAGDRIRRDASQGDLLHWVFLYGVAYATIRHEEPLIGESTAQEIAKQAASKVSCWYMSPSGKQEED